nr:pentatricopeptide repeat-containing protein, chloroplastic [Quercus suber]
MLSYSTFGDPAASRFLFQQTFRHCRNAFLWNTLIRANSIAKVFDGFETYNRMVRTGVRPDDHTFPFVLKACSDYTEVQKGMEVHGVVFKLGFDLDVYVGNTLLMFYGNCGSLSDARKVFDEMPERDAVSWNTIIGVLSVNGCYGEAHDIFKEMNLDSGFRPNLVTVVSVLPVCAGLEDGVMVRRIHCYVVKIGLDIHLNIGNAMVDAYGKCGNVKATKQVFDEMVERNEVSWNAIITSLAFMNRNLDALERFGLMIDTGFKPNSVTISSMLPVLVELEHFKAAKEIHGFSIRMGIEDDVFIANSLIDMLELAAVQLVREMQAHGETPNSVTFTNVLPACARQGLLHPGKEIHARTIRTGSANDLFVSNALTDMYAKCGCLNLAQNVFNISLRDEVSYNILIVGYSQTSDSSKSLSLFLEMRLTDHIDATKSATQDDHLQGYSSQLFQQEQRE